MSGVHIILCNSRCPKKEGNSFRVWNLVLKQKTRRQFENHTRIMIFRQTAAAPPWVDAHKRRSERHLTNFLKVEAGWEHLVVLWSCVPVLVGSINSMSNLPSGLGYLRSYIRRQSPLITTESYQPRTRSNHRKSMCDNTNLDITGSLLTITTCYISTFRDLERRLWRLWLVVWLDIWQPLGGSFSVVSSLIPATKPSFFNISQSLQHLQPHA